MVRSLICIDGAFLTSSKGGMENPIFTFATPTIISGDRENVDVIAHELSHSWSGNLVSNASWEHLYVGTDTNLHHLAINAILVG